MTMAEPGIESRSHMARFPSDLLRMKKSEEVPIILMSEKFDADFAYTMDGDTEGEIQYENFNAADAVFEMNGVNVHPGSAKDVMVNAALVAMEINSLIPAGKELLVIPKITKDFITLYKCQVTLPMQNFTTLSVITMPINLPDAWIPCAKSPNR